MVDDEEHIYIEMKLLCCRAITCTLSPSRQSPLLENSEIIPQGCAIYIYMAENISRHLHDILHYCSADKWIYSKSESRPDPG